MWLTAIRSCMAGVFNLRNGRLIDLDIDFAHLMDDIQKIYDITDSHWVVNQRKVG